MIKSLKIKVVKETCQKVLIMKNFNNKKFIKIFLYLLYLKIIL